MTITIFILNSYVSIALLRVTNFFHKLWRGAWMKLHKKIMIFEVVRGQSITLPLKYTSRFNVDFVPLANISMLV